LLAALEDKPGRVVLVDLGGGVMTVARGDESQIDALVVVVEPYPRSTEVARRLLEMAAAKGITRRVVVANKVGSEEDLDWIRELLGVDPDIVIPKDGAVLAADRAGASPIDHDPSSPAIATLRQLASSLLVTA
jgi:CO dehydrogenase nickel-insertion accessory protein CooC1